MSDESREQRWLRLVDEEQKAFERANSVAETAGPARRMNLAREWFLGLSRVLREHASSHMMADLDGPLTPYPGLAVSRAAELFDNLAAGRVMQPIKDVTVCGGRPDGWSGEREDIAVAIHYVVLARAKKIADRSFIKTVSEAFCVDRTTVEGWLRRRQPICDGIPQTPRLAFPEALKKAGARYHFNRTGKKTPGVE